MKDPGIFLEHIVTSSEIIAEYIEGMRKGAFLKSPKTQDAVIRRLEIIGEAAKRLSEDVRRRDTRIPWKQITGMRDILIHQYFSVDMEFVWKTVKKDVPLLAKRLRQLSSV